MKTKTIEAIVEAPSFAYADESNILAILRDACFVTMNEKNVSVQLDCCEQIRVSNFDVVKLYVVKSTYIPYLHDDYNSWIGATVYAIQQIPKLSEYTIKTITGIEHAISVQFGAIDASNDFFHAEPECKVYWAKVKEGGKIPTKRTEDAGYDIYPCFDEDFVILHPHTTTMIPTGIASSIPVGYEFQIEERGSSGSKGIKYSAGVFDSGFRGEWMLLATNTNNIPVVITKNMDIKMIGGPFEDGFIKYPYEKALFQAILINTNNHITTQEITYDQLLSIPSERGAGKLGSSGK